jgi:hypothetical protein
MAAAIRETIGRKIGGDHQRIDHVDTTLSRTSFKHVLLPIWISSYRFGDKTFRFLVNARTGEVQGDRPYSAVKIALAVIAALLVFAAIIWMPRATEIALLRTHDALAGDDVERELEVQVDRDGLLPPVQDGARASVAASTIGVWRNAGANRQVLMALCTEARNAMWHSSAGSGWPGTSRCAETFPSGSMWTRTATMPCRHPAFSATGG